MNANTLVKLLIGKVLKIIKKIQDVDETCTRDDVLQNQLREMVFELDDYTCQKCGKSKEDYPDLILHCHHIIPFKADISLASDINNCITLCSECHNYFHNQTPECSYGNLAKI